MPNTWFYIKGGLFMFVLTIISMVITSILFYPVHATASASGATFGGVYGWSWLSLIELFVGSVILFWLVLKFKKEMGISK